MQDTKATMANEEMVEKVALAIAKEHERMGRNYGCMAQAAIATVIAASGDRLYRALKEVRAKGERIKKEANAFQDVGASLEATITIKVCDEILNLSGEPAAPVDEVY